MTDLILILVTCGKAGEAKRIAGTLLRKKLVACANVTSGVKSEFWWKGKLDSAKETLLMLKARKADFKKIRKEVKAMHSYEVPEIIAIPVVAGDKQYLNWARRQTCRVS